MKYKLLFAVWLLLPGITGAADFYISSIHPNRSDAHSGTSPDAPWATWSKIQSAWGSSIRAGDTVHLERGSTWTWNGSVFWQITQGGSAASGPITIRGDDYGSGPLPVLHHTGGDDDGHTFIITGSASYITLRDFVVDGGLDEGAGATGVYVGGPNHSGDISHINVLNMTFRNLGNGSQLYICGIYLSPWNDRKISNCLIEGNDVSGFNAHGLNHYPEKRPQKHNSTLHDITWRNNRVHNPSPTRYSGVESGIQLNTGGGGNVVECNYVEGPNEDGSIKIANCSNDETGLIIRNNVVRDNTTGHGIRIIFDSSAPYTDIAADIYGNVVIGSQQPGLTVQAFDYFSGRFSICNNTFYDNNHGPSYAGEIWVVDQNDNIELHLQNNIIVHKSNNGVCLSVGSNYSGTLTHSHNLYWDTRGPSTVAIKSGQGQFTVANATDFEPTAQHADPQFENPSQLPGQVNSATGIHPDGLAPKVDSPAIDNGVDLGSSYASSVDLAPRPQAQAWDIGAYEVVQTETVPNPPEGLVVTAP